MNEREYDLLIGEFVFLEAWEGGLLPAVSGLDRVRQFLRANPGPVAEYRRRRATVASRAVDRCPAPSE